MITEATFIKEFTNNTETQQQIEQIQRQLNILVSHKGASSEALEELKITNNQVNQLLSQFNRQNKEDSATLFTKSKQLEQVNLLLIKLASKYQETYSEKLLAQLKYYAKSFASLSKKFEVISLTKQTVNPSDFHFIEMLRLLSEYLNISWETFPEEVMMYGSLAKGMTKKDRTSNLAFSESDLFLNNALNSYIQIASEAAQKALEFYCQQTIAQEIENRFDNLIKKSKNQLEINILQKVKQETKLYPTPIKEGSKNVITFEVSTLEDEIFSGQDLKEEVKEDIVVDEKQIQKNQPVIKHLQKQIEEINNMTEAEIKNGEEFEQILLGLIEENRF